MILLNTERVKHVSKEETKFLVNFIKMFSNFSKSAFAT